MRFALAVGLLLLSGCSSPRTPPAPVEWVTDTRNLLDRGTRLSVTAKLDAFYKRTHHMVLVWVGTTTHGEPHFDYCLRAFNTWGFGRDRYDDAIIVFIFPDDDMRWITVGYGLEAALTDREATHIARNVMAPLMRAGRPDEAVTLGVDLVLSEIDTWEKH